MEATLENGYLVIKIKTSSPSLSKSGKSLVIASTKGNVQTTVNVNGKPVIIGLNAYIEA
jgi:hypothetical protein